VIRRARGNDDDGRLRCTGPKTAEATVIAAQRQYIEIYASFVAFIEPGGAA